MRPGLALAAVAAAVLAAPATAGATLAYEKGGAAPSEIWAAADDGSNPRKLGAGYQPRVSPDGTLVAYTSSGSSTRLRVVAASGAGGAKTVASGVDADSPVWSPDGTKLAVVTGVEIGSQTLKVVDLATGTSRTLASGYFYGVTFSPAGDRLAWSRARTERYPTAADVYVAGVASGAAKRITTDRRSLAPVWGPARIAFARATPSARRDDYAKNDLYTMLPDGTGVKRLTRTKVPYLLSGLTPLAFSADGARLLAQYGGQDTAEAWTVDPASGKARDVDGRFDGLVGYGLSRDGTTVLAMTGGHEGGGDDHDVVAIPYAGGAKVTLVKRAMSPSWSR